VGTSATASCATHAHTHAGNAARSQTAQTADSSTYWWQTQIQTNLNVCDSAHHPPTNHSNLHSIHSMYANNAYSHACSAAHPSPAHCAHPPLC
jgi:hypothetical protein